MRITAFTPGTARTGGPGRGGVPGTSAGPAPRGNGLSRIAARVAAATAPLASLIARWRRPAPASRVAAPSAGIRVAPVVPTSSGAAAVAPVPAFAAGPRLAAAPSLASTIAEAEADRTRLRLAWGLALGVAVLVGVRLFTIQIVRYPRYAELARRQHLASWKLPASRGTITDRNGRPLAVSQEAAAIYLVPRYFYAGKGATRAQLDRVCAALGRSGAAVRAEATRRPFVWLKRPATPADVERVRELCRDLRIQGVGWEPLCVRMYPEGRTASHVLGCTNDEGKGLEGVEYAYDKWLHRGGDVRPILRDSRGRLIFTGGAAADDPGGARLRLTMDAGLQHAAERELEEGLDRAGAKWGCAIVLDPGTGELLALANAPRFSPDAFEDVPADVRANHAVTHVFEPGSTFKLVTLAAALQESLVREEDETDCERGAFALGDEVIHDVEAYGRLTLAEMFAFSSNIGFAKLGLKLGGARLLAKAREFGFGESTRAGIPGEERGLLRRPAEKFDVAAMAFGQGLGVTAIQMAAAYGAIANHGVLMRPYAVAEVRDASGRVRVSNRPEKVRQVVSAAVARRLTALLTGVVDVGTGRPAAIRGVRVAGKTGTSQKSDAKGYLPEGEKLVTFVGFVPADAPRFVVLVTLDRPKWGTAGGVAGPVFREIALAALRSSGVPAGSAGALAYAGGPRIGL